MVQFVCVFEPLPLSSFRLKGLNTIFEAVLRYVNFLLWEIFIIVASSYLKDCLHRSKF